MTLQTSVILSGARRALATRGVEGPRRSRPNRPNLPATALLLLLPLAAGCQRPAQPAVTTITIGPEILHTHVKRLGINLSGQSFYDSGQMLRNLTFRNPGFEGETWQSILHCVAVTPTSCTDENQYTVWPEGFLSNAHYEIVSGPATGTSGTVAHSTAAVQNHGVTLTLTNPAKLLRKGDFLLVRIDKPGTAEAGWWTNLQGGATLATEFHDLSPNTPGKQALRIEASGPNQSAAISSYFDSMQGHSFVQLHGKLTLSFRAKRLSSMNLLTVNLERLDTIHGRHAFFAQVVPLTPQWHDYTFTFDAEDGKSAVGTVGLTFNFDRTSALLDDVALTAAPAPGNPTAFRNEVVQALRDLRPGVLRYMDNGGDFGSSLDNMLAPPFARRRSGSSTQVTLQEDIPLGLHEFLTLSKAVGAEPWYSMPPGTSPEEAAALAEYLSGPPTSRYGQIRAKLGQSEPWTSVFPTIHLELGNEQWNHQSFAGSTIDDPTAYGQRAAQIFAALRNSSFDLILGSWATVPWWSQQELSSFRESLSSRSEAEGSASSFSLAVAPYLFNDFNDASTTEAVFGPMFAEPEMIDSQGYMAQQAALHPNLSVYEVNLGSMTGNASITQSDIDRAIPSLGAGLAVADHMLLMLRDLGVTNQCLFALPEYDNNFTVTGAAGGPKRMIPLWGAVVDMGGPTNARRPQFLAEQLANQAILPTMLTTHIAGPNPTWNQPESPNDKVRLENAHLLQTFAFAEGSRRSLILLNLSRTESLPVILAKPPSPIEESLLTSTNITDSNEASSTVSTRHRHLADLPNPYLLPPHSMTVLEWRTALPQLTTLHSQLGPGRPSLPARRYPNGGR